MVDRNQRMRLRDALSELIEGRLTNDQFDELYFTEWEESPDRGVREIADFGFSLYSSDLPFPYRLKGRYAPDAETKRIADRCQRFLNSDLEYAWPERPNQTLDCAFGGISVFLVIPLGVVLLLAGFFDLQFVALGSLVVACGYLLLRVSRSMKTPEWRAYWAAGDKDAWPFLHLAELQEVKSTKSTWNA